MEGRVILVNPEQGYGTIDTQNREVGKLRFYLDKINFLVQVGDTVSFTVKTSAAGNRYAVDVAQTDRNKSKFNTEDKQLWYAEGEGLEGEFLESTVPLIGRDVIKNPEKETCPWVIDFCDLTDHCYADLKTQNTPFFAAVKYFYCGRQRYDPRYTVTFNRKDYENYKQNYPGCNIYWNVEWKQLTYKGSSIEYLRGVWLSPLRAPGEKIESGQVVLHSYQHRVNDDKNAKESYLFDLRDTSVFTRLL